MLLIVGRQDTGDLEAQIRGSRHAWDIRIISVDALLRLMSTKEEVEDPLMMQKIHSILVLASSPGWTRLQISCFRLPRT